MIHTSKNGLCLTHAALLVLTVFRITRGLTFTEKIMKRRTALLEFSTCVAWSCAPMVNNAATLPTPIVNLFHTSSITIPNSSRDTEFPGVDNLYFPPWLEGEWQATQTLVNTENPLGLKFIGGPAGSEEIASKSMEEQRKQMGKPVQFRLRWVGTKFGVTEDRLFNLRQRLDSFAGRSVVSSVEYANVSDSNRASMLALGGREDDPLQTTLVYFKGPAAQKSFVTAHGSEDVGRGEWAGFELSRSIFALTNQNTAPPITTDVESIWDIRLLEDGRVQGNLRLASFLNAQSDSLYFEAKNRAVSIQDYTLELRRL